MPRLNPDDRLQLLTILQSVPELKSPEGIRQVLILGDLEDVLPGLNLHGLPFVVLGELVSKLENFGRVTYEHEALGLFLSVVKQLLGEANPNRAVLDRLITTYHLMTPTPEPASPPAWAPPPSPGEVLEKIIGENTLRPIAFL
jgi:hypothetical protein